MKYTTIEYDANRPSAKQIAVPLNSEYGVAVEVCKNGEKLPLVSSDLSVGEYTGETINGFTCVQLSSGSQPGRTEYDVSVKDVDGKFKLIVRQKDMGYFDIPKFEPEPEPKPDPVEIEGYYEEYSDSTVYSGDAMIEENLTLPAAAVMSFDCSVSGEPVTDFMRIVVCTADGNWFTKPGDTTYGNLWYEAEGGTGRTAQSITLTQHTKFALLHAEDESVTIWKLVYDKNKLPE